MRKTLTKILALGVTTALLLSLTACSSSSSSSSGESDGSSSTSDSSTADNSTTSGEPIELSFVRIGNDQGEADYWKDLIKRYEEKYTNVKIKYDDAAIGEPMETKLTTMFAGNAGPDLIGHGIMSVASRVEAGHYIPITEQFNKWDGKDDIMPSVLANGTYNDEIYGIAYSTTPFIFAYRKDLLESAGYDKAPETWEQLAEYAQKLTVKNGDKIETAGFAFPSASGNFVEYDVFAFGNGGRYYDDAGNITLNTPDKVEAFEFLRTLVNDYNLPYNSNEVNPFITGNAAMTLINNVALKPMLDNPEFADKIGIAVPPSNKTQATFSGCNMLFVGRDCKNVDEAFDFIEMSASKEDILKRSKDLNIPVVRQSAVADFIAQDPMNEVRAKCVEIGIGMPLKIWAPAFQRIRNELVQNVLYTDVDIETALADAQAQLESENK